jgi:hypothetical protein
MTSTREILKRLKDFTVILCSSPDKLVQLEPVVTVEAEYGDRVVEGSALTLAHHGSRSDNPAPCIATIPDLQLEEPRIIGLSHIDLDSLGGILRVLERLADVERLGTVAFWTVAAKVDTNGAHKLPLYADDSTIENAMLHAWWAWNENNKIYPERDGSPLPINDWVHDAIVVLDRIFQQDPDLLAAGQKFKEEDELLNAQSFRGFGNGVLWRQSEKFVNHLYRGPQGQLAMVVVSINPKSGAIIVSRENDGVPVNCRDLVQSLWGPEAGGHNGIAGSPRDQVMTDEDLTQAVKAILGLLP